MNTLTAHDIRRILDGLDKIDELTTILRNGHFTVPYPPISAAVGAAFGIRDTILRAALMDVTVEPVGEREAV